MDGPNVWHQQRMVHRRRIADTGEIGHLQRHVVRGIVGRQGAIEGPMPTFDAQDAQGKDGQVDPSEVPKALAGDQAAALAGVAGTSSTVPSMAITAGASQSGRSRACVAWRWGEPDAHLT
jgi:hypothetical protein